MGRLLVAGVALVSITYLYLTLRLLIGIDVTFPVLDHWSHFAALLVHADKGTIHRFIFGQINEHRPIILLTVMLLDYLHFDFQLRLMAFVHLASYALLVAAMTWLGFQTRDQVDVRHRKSAALLGAVSGLFLTLNMRQWEVHYGYENVGTVHAFLFFTLAVYLYNRRIDFRESGGRPTNIGLAGLLVLGIMGAASMAFGLLTIPALLVISVLRKAPRHEFLAWSVSACASFLVYSIDMNLTPSASTQWKVGIEDALLIFRLAAILLGTLFTADKGVAFFLGMFGLACTLAVAINFATRRVWTRSLPSTIFATLLFALVYALMVGIGRRHMGVEGSTAFRYLLASAIFWHCLFCASLNAALRIAPAKATIVLPTFGIAAGSIVIACLFNQKDMSTYLTGLVAANSVAVTALQAGIDDRDEFRSLIIPIDDRFFANVKSLKDHQTSIFRAPVAQFHGRKIAEILAVDNRRCRGDISVMSERPLVAQFGPSISSQGLKLFGWTWPTRPGRRPSHVLFANQHGVIRGSAVFTVPTPEIAKLIRDPSAVDAGWVGFARREQGDEELLTYAYYEKEETACLFNRTKYHEAKIR